MAETAETLNKKRGALKRLTTRIINKIKFELNADSPDVDELEEFLNQLLRKEDLVINLNNQISSLIGEEEIEQETESAEEYMEGIIAIKTKATRAIKKLGNISTTSSTTAIVNEDTDDQNVNQEIRSRTPTVKLPKLSITKFGGDLSEWQNFWNQYRVAVHENRTISKSDKFTYLKSYLEKSASKAISGLAISDKNYDEAVAILTKRFGRTDLIIQHHKAKLLKLDHVKRSTDITALRTLYDTCEVEVRSLSALGVGVETFNGFLWTILFERMPSDIALEYTRKQQSGIARRIAAANASSNAMPNSTEAAPVTADMDGRELLDFLGCEVESREMMYALIKPEPTGSLSSDGRYSENRIGRYSENRSGFRPRQNGATSRGRIPTATNLTTGVEPRLPCIFCGDDKHSTSSCQKLNSKQRSDVIREQRRCYLCLRENHMFKDCRSRTKCRYCNRRHHFSLCESEKWKRESNSHQTSGRDTEIKTTVTEPQSNEETSALTSISYPIRYAGKTVLLQTTRALLRGGEQLQSSRYVRCLIDGGAQRTFIKESVSRSLNLKIIGEERLRVFTFGCLTPVISSRRKVEFQLINTVYPSKKITVEALEIPHISSAPISIPDEEITDYLEAHGLQLADDSSEATEIEILLASDFIWRISSGEYHRITPSLVASETIFGWTVQGPTDVPSLTAAVHTISALKAESSTDEQQLSAQIKTFWDLDTMGIKDVLKPVVTEKQTLERFESSIIKIGDRYQVRLPWKENRDELKDNYRNAERRALQLVKRFRNDPSLFNQYRKIICDQLNEGVIEVVPEAEIETTNTIFYLPHHPVIRPDKETTSLRIVYDGSSAETDAPSLNNCLDSGPNLNPELLDVLLRFRSYAIVCIGDIEKAFLQISLAPTDRDALRFLWPKDDLGHEFQTMRITRVPFGVTSSPFLLSATIRQHIQKYEEQHPEVCAKLQDDLYVDDFTSGDSTVAKALKISTEAKRILGDAGMNLRKWISNSKELETEWRKIENQNLGDIQSMEINSTNEPLKVLGLTWDSKQDTLQLDLNPISAFTADKKITKRHVLRTVSRIFDPIGFLSPYVIRVKILFQELWEAGIEWDDRLSPDMALKFESWCNELSSFGSLALPRHYFLGLKEEDLRKISLVTFTDASELAYAACSYIRYVTYTGEIGVSFITSKSRVSPLKKLSLPRLELMGALLGARLSDYIKQALRFKIEDVKLFSDSMITLHWIKGSSRPWKPFVSNRVAEIQSLSEPTSWNHVKGSTNPADMPTRGKRADDLINNQLWWEGPSWLKLEEDLWPTSKFEAPNQEAVQEERRTIKGEVVLSSCVSSTKQPLLDLNRYSEYLKVKRISSWILRFIHNCRKPSQKRQGPLTAEELFFGEIVLIRQSQEETFEAEMHQLINQKSLPKTSPITDLDPQLDQHMLLFVKGRLDKGQFTFRQKHPWIISGKSRLAELLASYHHRNVMSHAGLNDTLSSLREEFWVTRGRQTVKKIVDKCGRCKRFRVKAAQQIVAPLPADRITPAQPFSITGVDFGGPLIVRTTKNSSQKCYIALLTCATTRAVHLELVTDLSTEKFLMAFRRFLSRRGVPSVIYSDNARTFKRAEQDLKDIFTNLKHPEVADFLSAKGISWKPIVERAAWWGGFWERLIQSTKSILRKVIGRASLTYEELETFLIETEAILNSRPITYMYHNIDEPTPLSPSHFLTGQRQTSLPSRRFNTTEKMTANRQELTKRFRYRQNLLDQLWNRWKIDYLFQLRTAHHQKQPKVSNELKEGDIVLIHELRTPRMLWKMGKISNTFVGRDQKIRSCELKLANGTYLKRPVQLLYPLEC